MQTDRITKAGLRNHWRYNWWKYVLMTALLVMGLETLFAVTAYRPPADRSLTVYVCHSSAATDAMQEALWPTYHEKYPEQEQLTVQNINLTNDDIYTQMQFSTYIAARQGDVVILPRDFAANLIGEEGPEYTFVELSPYIERGVLRAPEDRAVCLTFANPDGSVGLYGIPTDSLRALEDYNCRPEGGYMCILAYSENMECAAGMIELLLESFQ